MTVLGDPNSERIMVMPCACGLATGKCKLKLDHSLAGVYEISAGELIAGQSEVGPPAADCNSSCVPLKEGEAHPR